MSPPAKHTCTAAPPGNAASAHYRNFRICRVLVADDSAVNREVAIEALSRLGAQVETVEDGARGRQRRREPFA